MTQQCLPAGSQAAPACRARACRESAGPGGGPSPGDHLPPPERPAAPLQPPQALHNGRQSLWQCRRDFQGPLQHCQRPANILRMQAASGLIKTGSFGKRTRDRLLLSLAPVCLRQRHALAVLSQTPQQRRGHRYRVRCRPMRLWQHAICGDLMMFAPAEGWTSAVRPRQACRGEERQGLQQPPWRRPAALPPPAADGRLASCGQPSIITTTPVDQIILTHSFWCCAACVAAAAAGLQLSVPAPAPAHWLMHCPMSVLVQIDDSDTDRPQPASCIHTCVS